MKEISSIVSSFNAVLHNVEVKKCDFNEEAQELSDALYLVGKSRLDHAKMVAGPFDAQVVALSKTELVTRTTEALLEAGDVIHTVMQALINKSGVDFGIEEVLKLNVMKCSLDYENRQSLVSSLVTKIEATQQQEGSL